MRREVIILFDGHCLLCSRWVRRIYRNDAAGIFRFAAQQSAAGQAVLRDAGFGKGLQGGLVVRTAEGRIVTHADAVVYVGLGMRQPWRVLARIGGLVPRGVREFVYGLVARHRYRIFGRTETCMMPEEGLRERFLEEAPVGGPLTGGATGP